MIANVRSLAVISLIAGCNGTETQTGPVQADVSVSGGVDGFDLRCVAGSCGGEFLTGPQLQVVPPYQTSRYFITRAEYGACMAQELCPPEPAGAAETRAGYSHFPAGRYLWTLALPNGEGAKAYCAANGGSLLTPAQFLFGADGPFPSCFESQLTLGCITSLSGRGLGGRARVPQFLMREDGRLFVGGAGLFLDEIEGVDPKDPAQVAHVRCAW